MDIESILEDQRNEPSWRFVASKEADYYDGNQLDNETLALMEDRGMLPIVHNLIGPAIDAVLGMEEKNRQDWKVVADDEEDTDEAVALSRELHETERLSGADRAVSDAYASQVKIGAGWVEVGRNRDPFGFRHKCYTPRWREMCWDWRAREPLLEDARYLYRKRWLDEDLLERMFPRKRQLITSTAKGWAHWDWDTVGEEPPDQLRGWEVERRSSLEEEEWRDQDRNRYLLYEVWYRQYDNGKILRVPEKNIVVEFDPRSERHVALVNMGLAELETAILPRMRLAWWLGPHKLADMPTPFAHNDFPYVPFFGMREDKTGVPYGLIRRMMSPQDEVNTRRTKMLWLLSAKRVMGDSDAFDLEESQLLEEVGRPDAWLPLNPKRQNPNQTPKVESDRDMSAQQFNVLQYATQAVPEMAGIYQAMMGKEMTQQSGVAINSLVEQSGTTLAELNGNYRLAKTKAGRLLMTNRLYELRNRQFQIMIKRGQKKKIIYFNKIEEDEEGNPRRNNALSRIRTRVDLTDVPETPAFKVQMLNQLMELAKSLDANQKAIIMPMIVETTQLPERHEIAEQLRSSLGQGDDAISVLSRAREEALGQQVQQQALEESAAKTAKLQAETEKLQVETQQALAEMKETLKRIEQIALQQIPPLAQAGGDPVYPGGGQPA